MFALSRYGSSREMAAHYGVSESFIRNLFAPHQEKPDILSDEEMIRLIERYGSVRLTARMTKLKEGVIRRFVMLKRIEHLLRYDFSNHNNAKGRRAELYWASLQKEGEVLEDMNLTQGPLADWDFTHKTLGMVNVKSSKAHRYTAKTRRDNPLFWTFSSGGLRKADTVALVLYDERMLNPLYSFDLPVVDAMMASTSFRVRVTRGVLEVQYTEREIGDKSNVS